VNDTPNARPKYLALTESLHRYLCRQRSDASDLVLEALREETAALGDEARMQISEEEGAFLSILTAAIGAKSAIEVGTFTGYSSICIARGLGADGRLLCLDASEEWTAIARSHWQAAGVADRIELRLGPALASLDALEADQTFDLAFIDADKLEYDAYFERLLPRIRPNGVILFDNMPWGGRLVNPGENDGSGRALDALNRKLASDPRVETVLLPVADGIQVCRKR
jgi:caffeoyl-CoA O-methyltransferase